VAAVRVPGAVGVVTGATVAKVTVGVAGRGGGMFENAHTSIWLVCK